MKVSDLGELTKAELVQLCERFAISPEGTKEELIAKLSGVEHKLAGVPRS